MFCSFSNILLRMYLTHNNLFDITEKVYEKKLCKNSYDSQETFTMTYMCCCWMYSAAVHHLNRPILEEQRRL